mgnify:CR=1 FL=1
MIWLALAKPEMERGAEEVNAVVSESTRLPEPVAPAKVIVPLTIPPDDTTMAPPDKVAPDRMPPRLTYSAAAADTTTPDADPPEEMCS